MPEAAPNRATAKAWPTEALGCELAALWPGLQVQVVAETDSTNTRLIERVRAGDTGACLLVAERQTAGRGRLGRAWYSQGDASLVFSLGLALAPASWSGLSLAVGVALAEALHPKVLLKWPNDLWLAGESGVNRKLGGILIETLPRPDAPAGGKLRHAVVGVGLNLDAPPHSAGLAQAAGWRELEPAASAPELLARLAAPLLRALLQFERDGFSAFAERFAARDALRGQPVRTSGGTAADVTSGRADGVDAHGALRVRTERGLCLVSSAEVSVHPC